MAAEARRAGDPEIASSLKKLRKPSVGAWLANLLVLEQASDVEHLIDLGTELRAPNRRVEGAQIRRVSKEKGEAVSRLLRNANRRLLKRARRFPLPRRRNLKRRSKPPLRIPGPLRSFLADV